MVILARERQNIQAFVPNGASRTPLGSTSNFDASIPTIDYLDLHADFAE